MEKIIEQFLSDKKPVIVGISKDEKKWGNELYRQFIKNGYSPLPVAKNVDSIDGVKCFSNLSELPDNAQNIVFAIPKGATEDLIDNLPQGRFKRIWFVYGTKSKNIIEKAESKGIETVYGYCPMMFLDRNGIHKFHYFLKKLFS